MTRKELIQQIRIKQSFLCIGLDTNIAQIPSCLLSLDDPIFEFNKQIIDATKDLCVAYKPNLAFYESLGPKGWESLKKTIDYIPDAIFSIADAKRGDIGNTSNFYAKTFFEYLNCDAVTISPYMGKDSVLPFLSYENKWTVLLALTSNEGAMDFQTSEFEDGSPLYKSVIRKAMEWDIHQNLMFVVGATRAEMIRDIRNLAPDHFFLVPGFGAQGGSLQDVVNYGWNDDCGLLINSSRSIIYASDKEDFAEKARKEAQKIQAEMAEMLRFKAF